MTVSARSLFAPLGPTYDRVGATLSLGQDPRWRRFLVSRLPGGSASGHVLDVATGTGLVAAELLRRGYRVTGVDQSPEMLAVARRRFGDRIRLIEASAQALPLESGSFDHLTFTYLLRYVASLEFGVPSGPARPAWHLYVRTVLPLAGRVVGNGWPEVGDFLGGSIRDFWRRYPLEQQLKWWHAAGVHVLGVKRMSLGGGVVIWGRRT
jgi:demethylmenaquinone methyltransferase/2-methoxy-6-polyprenyl-1,4-benzoquinol methylase